MVYVIPIEDAKANYRSGATVAPERYKSGIARVTDWTTKASSTTAETLWAAKIQAAITAKRRQTGCAAVSNATWQALALDKGGNRIGPGMTAGADKWGTKWAKFKTALEAVTLPARTADPTTNVNNRLLPIVRALVAAKGQ